MTKYPDVYGLAKRTPGNVRTRGLLQRIRRFGRNDDGTAAIEFAVLGIPFFMLIGGIAEMGFNYLGDRVLNYGVDEISRQIKTGQIRGNVSESDFKMAFCNLPLMSLFDCNKVAIDVKQVASFEPKTPPERDAEGNLDTSNFGFQPGGRLTINVVRATYEWPTVLQWSNVGADSWGGGKRLIVGSSAFLIEPF